MNTSSRAEVLRRFRALCAIRAEQELLAVMAIAAMGEIDWQDALDVFAETLDSEMQRLTGAIADKRDKRERET